jgi:outer membrane protein assembly factor BamB
MAVIDIDRAPAQSPSRPRLRGPLAAAVGVLCLLTLTAAQVPRSRGLPVLWSRPISITEGMGAVNHTSVYAIEGALLSAYEPGEGSLRWQVPAPGQSARVSLSGPGLVLLRSRGDGGLLTTAVDERTGRTLWSAAGSQLGLSDRLALLGDWNDGDLLTGARGVDRSTGAPLWSARPASGREWDLAALDPAAPDRLVTVTGDGHAESRDTATGALLASATVPRPPREGEDPDATRASYLLAGHTFFLEGVADGQRRFTAYDTETLRPRWSRPLDYLGNVGACGSSVVCVAGITALVGYDAGTGRDVLRFPGDTRLMPITGDRIGVGDSGASRLLLVEPATGRRIAELGISSVLDRGDIPAGPYYATTNTVRDDKVVVAVMELDPATGETWMRGVLGVPDEAVCRSAGPVLVCGKVGEPGVTAYEVGSRLLK